MTLGQRIQKLRREIGLSQEALAKTLYVTRQSVSQWENDKSMPSIDLLIKLSEIFDTTVDGLLGKEYPAEAPSPIARAAVLSRPREIFRAMSTDSEPAAGSLAGLAAAFCIYFFLRLSCVKLAFSEVVLRDHFPLGYVYPLLWITFACLAPALVLLILRVVNINRSAKSAGNIDKVSFFYDRLIIEPENGEPLSLFYSNVRSISENDFYIIMKMQNRIRLCIDKRRIDGSLEELCRLLKSGRNYRDKRLFKKTEPKGGEKAAGVLRNMRELLFILSIFCPQYTGMAIGIVYVTNLSAAARWAVLAAPSVLAFITLALGIVLTIKKARAVRMIVAGAVCLIYSCFSILYSAQFSLYNFQNHRVTPEEFTCVMQNSGMNVENTIRGRQETYIETCLTASAPNGTFEVLYMDFDDSSSSHGGLRSAYEFYQTKYAEIISQWTKSPPRSSQLDLGFNSMYTLQTESRLYYLSLNENTVIYFNVGNTRTEELKTALSEFKLDFP